MGDVFNPATDQVAFHREFDEFFTTESRPAGTADQRKPKPDGLAIENKPYNGVGHTGLITCPTNVVTQLWSTVLPETGIYTVDIGTFPTDWTEKPFADGDARVLQTNLYLNGQFISANNQTREGYEHNIHSGNLYAQAGQTLSLGFFNGYSAPDVEIRVTSIYVNKVGEAV